MKSEYSKLAGTVAVRSCRVTVEDVEGVLHTAEVTAASLYEAVALGLAAIHGDDWARELTEGTVEVS
jgi:hypothetical protein